MDTQATASFANRRRLIEALEGERGSRVITFYLSDRQHANAQIAEDAVRPMFDHLRRIGRGNKIDLYLYSVGGLTDVPWRIVSMIREFTDEFSVLIPYKAMSAATMIAIGAGEIVMGPKGELGPIDPQLSIQRGDGETATQDQIGVEDIMAFVRFAKEQVGITDQAELGRTVAGLADKVDPRMLGQIYRAHSHIRDVARKLLAARSESEPNSPGRIDDIVSVLAEKTFQHGHAIGRKEAKSIGLNVEDASDALQEIMWELLEAYELLSRRRIPIDARTFIPDGETNHSELLTMGCIESRELAHHFTGKMQGRLQRQTPPQLNVNFSLNLQLPADIAPGDLPQAIQEGLRVQIEEAQRSAEAQLVEQLGASMPIKDIKLWLEDAAWRVVEEH